MIRKTSNISGKKSAGKMTNLQKPQNMTLEEWQIALRKKAALNGNFGITENINTDETGCYVVHNAKTRHIYKVIYRGEGSRWNYCSCMDFKSNQLGTCKHIEAVKHWLSIHHKRPVTSLPAYTSVYLAYRPTRRICIRYGTDNQDEFIRLAMQYFNADNELKTGKLESIYTFLTEARKISNTFQCYPDVLQYIVDLRDKQRRMKLVDEKCSDAALDWILHASLYPYQKEGIRFAIRAGRCIIADEMGLGKTIQAIGCAEVYRKEGLVSSVLVLCPTSLKYQWKKEIERFTDSDVKVIEGTHLQRKQQYEGTAFYKIVSYNSACNDIKILGSLRADMLIMDEAQRLKNWNTQISMAARRIESDYTVVLSGTPLENKLQELYSITQFVDQFCLGPFYKFVDLTSIFSESGQIVGYKNLNVVGRMLQGILIRRHKSEVAIQLPNRSDKTLYVTMTKEQRGIHDEYQCYVSQIVAKWHRMHFLSEKDRKRLLLMLSQMRMVCDSTYILDQQSRYDTKVDEVINIISDMMESGNDKIVVFSQWERMTRLVAMELQKRDFEYVNLNGMVPSEKRKDLMERFTNDATCRVFLSTDAGSTGLNLQSASIIVNLDLPWNPAVLEQRIARIYRIGQKKNIQVINFVSEQTIEERMLATLNFKSNLAQGILDDGEDSVFLDDSKFNKLMDTVNDVVDFEEPDVDRTNIEESEPAKEPIQRVIHFSDDDDVPLSDEAVSENDRHSITPSATNEDVEAQQLVSNGVSFFSQLAGALSSPEKTKALVEAIVKEDKETGKTMLEIPVPNKKSVEQMLQLFGRLMGDKS